MCPTTQPASNLLEAFELNLLLPQVLNRGDYYHVDFGEGVSPRRHQVYHLQTSGLVCLCESGNDCPAVVYVQQYMIQADPGLTKAGLTGSQLGDLSSHLARVHSDDYLLRFLPHACPVCGGRVKPDPRFNSRTNDGMIYAGWRCTNGGAKCFLKHKMARSSPAMIAARRANPDPYLMPPTQDGYPGVRLSDYGQPRREIDSDTVLWFQSKQRFQTHQEEAPSLPYEFVETHCKPHPLG